MKGNSQRHFQILRVGRIVLLITMAGLVTTCSTPTYTVQKRATPPPPLPSTEIYFYPARGQTPSQQERDRYECYLWAVKQSGFDPGQAQLAPHQRVEVKPAPEPGTDTAVGAFSGAVIGSMLAAPHDRGEGMLFGAITGALLGAASDTARQEQAQRIQQYYDAKEAQRYARLERQARDYRRAMTACLEGRGYAVE
ncbi:MAG: glycine zipper 2TM domain-containing protein [Thioalkalispiraceae bacterium]|jgi:hypothetical protein